MKIPISVDAKLVRTSDLPAPQIAVYTAAEQAIEHERFERLMAECDRLARQAFLEAKNPTPRPTPTPPRRRHRLVILVRRFATWIEST